MQSNFPKLSLLISVIFFGIILSLFLFFYGKIDKNNREAQLKEIEWQTEAVRRDEIKALDSSIKVIEAERVQLETHFAKSSDIVPFLDTIEKLAVLAGTTAEVVSVNISEDHNSLAVSMKASGGFENLYKYITLLENSPYELEFVSMDLQKHSEGAPDITKKNVSVWDAILKINLLSFTQ